MAKENMFVLNGRLNAGFDDAESLSTATSNSNSIEKETQLCSEFFQETLPCPPKKLNNGIGHGGTKFMPPNVEEQLFTVEQEQRNPDAQKYKRKKTLCLSALKCILSLMISVSLFVCVVASKISLVHIGQKLNYTAMYHNASRTVSSAEKSFVRETSFVMLVLLLVFPSVYTLFRAICNSGMKRSHPWPTKRAVIWVRTMFKSLFSYQSCL